MVEKHPTWTRRRFGRDRVHWVAYDDRPGAEGRSIVAQGYATSLVEADTAARSALAEAGMYRARRTAGGSIGAAPGKRPDARRPPGPASSGRELPPEYLYSRRHCEEDGGAFVHAHLVVKKTPSKVYATQQSCWWGLVGTGEEGWDPADRPIALDRARLERDGSAYSARYPLSDLYRSREAARDGSTRDEGPAFAVLGLDAPCSVEDIKTAYRRKALEVHPDRGGSPVDFLAVEDAYRLLLGAARGPDHQKAPMKKEK